MSWTQALRIRVMLDSEHEDVYRDIDILTNQTFEELHQAIVQIFGIESQDDLVSFFLADDFWNKTEELPMFKDYTYAEGNIADREIQVFMEKDRQRLCYTVGDLTPWEFQLEVMGAYEADLTTEYPFLAESHGLMPDEPATDDFKSEDSLLYNTTLDYRPLDSDDAEDDNEDNIPKIEDTEDVLEPDLSFFGDEEEFDEEEWGDLEFED